MPLLKSIKIKNDALYWRYIYYDIYIMIFKRGTLYISNEHVNVNPHLEGYLDANINPHS